VRYTCGMVTRRQINALARRIAERFRPSKIILFGSYACGAPEEDSDLDLLVVMPLRGAAVDKAIEIYREMDALGVLPHATDLMVRTPAQVRHRIAQNDFFMREIVEKERSCMKALVREWVTRAEDDYVVAAARAARWQVAKL